MALVKCKECGEEVSTKAKSCPKCGADAPKKTSVFTWFFVVSILAFIFMTANTNDKPAATKTSSTALSSEQAIKRSEALVKQLKTIPAEEFEKNMDGYAELAKLNPSNRKYKDKLAYYTKKKAAQDARNKKIEQQFSAWDGSHSKLERIIKQSMRDPKSYDHIKTSFWDMGDHIVVKTSYRGKNGFGGIVVNSAGAKVSISGDIIETFSQ